MSKRKITARIISLLILCVLTITTGFDALAQNAGDFSIHAIIPDNQVDKRQTYFDLRIEPGAKQTVQIVIDNSRTEELTARVQLNPASTAQNGLIIYSEPDKRDESMKVSIKDVAAIKEDTVTVPAGGSATVDIDINMPNEKLDGAILGGIVVTDENALRNAEVSEGVSIANIITYVIGLNITQNDKAVTPDFDLVSIAPDLVNYKTSVVSTLRNKAPLTVKNMKVNAKVYNSGSDTPIHELSLDNVEMAPQSTGDFVIDWNNTALAAGTYRLSMMTSYNGQDWTWDEEFTIAGEAAALNSQAVDIKQDFNGLYIVIGIISLILVVFLSYWLGKRNKSRSRG